MNLLSINGNNRVYKNAAQNKRLHQRIALTQPFQASSFALFSLSIDRAGKFLTDTSPKAPVKTRATPARRSSFDP